MLLDFINLKAYSGGALYLHLYDEIKNAVKEGVIKKGDRLPSIRQAAVQLETSRTTVENAYLRLCIEGIAESIPQNGYYITSTPKAVNNITNISEKSNHIRYDFTARKVDAHSADTDRWKKTVREVLRNTDELTSYGDSQGEIGLREALAGYSYTARGVRCMADNIVIGAGIGPLLNILCALLGRDITVGFEFSGFSQAEQIFSDYGIQNISLESDKNGAKVPSLIKNNADILFLMPSALSKISIAGISSRRNDFANWVNETDRRLIIEDDYNGELRYTARSLTAFQSKAPEKTVYIGSFSKLLLPSVRIAYMVLPDFLMKEFEKRKEYYNQTCGKVEQLALKDYIESGALEKHLRRLRKLYYQKSQSLIAVINQVFDNPDITLFESSLCVEVNLNFNENISEICKKAEKCGVKVMHGRENDAIRLCFSGIEENDYFPALILLKEAICDK